VRAPREIDVRPELLLGPVSHLAPGSRVLRVLLPEPEANEHTQSIRFETQQRSGSSENEKFVGAGGPDAGETF
jgi:hypothetical protein